MIFKAADEEEEEEEERLDSSRPDSYAMQNSGLLELQEQVQMGGQVGSQLQE